MCVCVYIYVAGAAEERERARAREDRREEVMAATLAKALRRVLRSTPGDRPPRAAGRHASTGLPGCGHGSSDAHGKCCFRSI